MKIISIYDQYHPVYRNINTGELAIKYYRPLEPENTDLILVHPQNGVESPYENNVPEELMIEKIRELYEEAKTLGDSYEDINIKFDEGFVVIRIKFNNGKVFDRSIYIKTI